MTEEDRHQDRLAYRLDAGLPITGLGPAPGLRYTDNPDLPQGPEGPCCLRRALREGDERRKREERMRWTLADVTGPASVFTTDEHVMQRLKVAAQAVLSADVVDTLEVAVIPRAYGDLLLKLRAKIWTEELGQIEVSAPVTGQVTATVSATARAFAEVPDSWWDHWKADHADTWWSRWFVGWRGYNLRTVTAEKQETVTRTVTGKGSVTARLDCRAAFPDPGPIASSGRFGPTVRVALPTSVSVTGWQLDTDV